MKVNYNRDILHLQFTPKFEHGLHQFKWLRLSTYSNLLIAKAKGAQHHIHIIPPPNSNTHTNLSVPPSRPFISGPPLQTHERMLCGDPGEKERGRKERENIKAGLCIESSWGVCAFVWGEWSEGPGPTLCLCQGLFGAYCIDPRTASTLPDTLQRHTRGGGLSGGV